MSEAMLFLAIHTHKYGTDVKVFKSEEMADEIFAGLPVEDEILLDAVDFAKKINIDYEPDKDEELSVQFIRHENFDIVSFKDFPYDA